MARKTAPRTITDYMFERRITASQLAAEIGISPQHLSEIRSRKKVPSLVVAVRIARLTGVSVESFVS